MTAPLLTAATAARRRARWHTGATLAVLLCAAHLAERHWPVLAAADQGWLLVAATVTLAIRACSALARRGAVAELLSGARLPAAQFVAGAANHVLPAASGRARPTSGS
ncbi:hypothetical protein [Streptomyces sp. JNUCC 63]